MRQKNENYNVNNTHKYNTIFLRYSKSRYINADNNVYISLDDLVLHSCN